MCYREQMRGKISRRNHEGITGYFKRFVLGRLPCICSPSGLNEVFPILPQFFLNYPDSPVKNCLVYEKLQISPAGKAVIISYTELRLYVCKSINFYIFIY